MFLNIIFLVLLYIFTLVIIFLSNIFYLIPGEFTGLFDYKIFFFTVIILYLLFFYLLFILIRGIYTKKLDKNYFYAYLGFWIFLIVFYFGYYTRFDKEPSISESEFETKLQNIELKDDENGLIQMEKLLEDTDKSILYLEDKSFYNKYNCLVERKGKNCDEVSLENILETYKYNYGVINVFNDEMKRVVEFDYFKQNTDIDRFVKLQGLTKLTRMSLFLSIYDLNLGSNKKAIDDLLVYKKLGDKLLNGDNSLVGMIVGMTIVKNSIDNINYVLDNYDLDNESLSLLKNVLIDTYNSKEIFANAIKMEYWTNKYGIEKAIGEGKIRTSMMFDLDEYTDEQRKAWLNVINGEENYFDAIPTNYFKRSFLYRFLGGSSLFSDTGYIDDLDDLNKIQSDLLKKINTKLGE